MLECYLQAHEEGACLWIVTVVNSTAYFRVVARVVSDGEEVAARSIHTELGETDVADESAWEGVTQLNVLQAEV